jgi:hypothetical protein
VSAPDARGLAAALAARGVACGVEGRERLAILIPSREWAELQDAARRREVSALAASFGFTHVALELEPGEPEAARASGAGRQHAGAADA